MKNPTTIRDARTIVDIYEVYALLNHDEREKVVNYAYKSLRERSNLSDQ